MRRYAIAMTILAACLIVCPIATADIVGDQTTLPPPYITPSANNRPKHAPWPAGVRPTAPAGFEVSVYAEKLNGPRWIYVLPNKDVLVAESYANRLSLFRDTDGDGKPDVHEIFLDQLNRPFGMALHGDSFYVANTDGVWIYPYKTGETTIEEPGQKIVDLPGSGYNNHWTRNLLIDSQTHKLYITVGSGTNCDENGADSKDSRRAAILQCNLDGSDLKIFANGIRNPVGLAFCPGTHTLWTAVNERDGLGDDLVPDYLTSVKENGFYGWPFSYYGQNVDPRHKGERTDLVERAIVPDFALGSHVAALGLAFCPTTTFPSQYHNGAFIGEHGSWNRSTRVGYKVAFVPFKKGKPAAHSQTFLGGFCPFETSQEVYGRPVGVAFAPDGSLLVADDGSGKIWRVTWRGAR
jgi:glucose/arabinose dehydrogenase